MFSGWSPTGIIALVAVVGGIVLLVAYAARRGLVDRELQGIETPADGPADPAMVTGEAAAPAAPAPRSGRARALGLAGAILLVAGLVLGAVSLAGSAGGAATGGPGLPPDDCAQAWEGCPKATP